MRFLITQAWLYGQEFDAWYAYDMHCLVENIVSRIPYGSDTQPYVKMLQDFMTRHRFSLVLFREGR